MGTMSKHFFNIATVLKNTIVGEHRIKSLTFILFPQAAELWCPSNHTYSQICQEHTRLTTLSARFLSCEEKSISFIATFVLIIVAVTSRMHPLFQITQPAAIRGAKPGPSRPHQLRRRTPARGPYRGPQPHLHTKPRSFQPRPLRSSASA